jgi:tetratricopeptide (TPR) repeat protein
MIWHMHFNQYSLPDFIMDDTDGNYGALMKKMIVNGEASTGQNQQAEGLVREGDIHDYLCEFELAIDSYNDALLADPGCADAWFNKAITLEKMGKHQEALRCIAVALNLHREFR